MRLINFLLLITAQVLSTPIKEEFDITSNNLAMIPIRYIVVQEPQKFYLEPVYQSNEFASTQSDFKLQKRNEISNHGTKEMKNEEVKLDTRPNGATIHPDQLAVGEFNNPSGLRAEENISVGTSPGEPWGWGGRGWGWGGRSWGSRGGWGWGGRWGGGWGGPWGGYY
jgi:hypothetical protein